MRERRAPSKAGNYIWVQPYRQCRPDSGPHISRDLASSSSSPWLHQSQSLPSIRAPLRHPLPSLPALLPRGQDLPGSPKEEIPGSSPQPWIPHLLSISGCSQPTQRLISDWKRRRNTNRQNQPVFPGERWSSVGKRKRHPDLRQEQAGATAVWTDVGPHGGLRK